MIPSAAVSTTALTAICTINLVRCDQSSCKELLSPLRSPPKNPNRFPDVCPERRFVRGSLLWARIRSAPQCDLAEDLRREHSGLHIGRHVGGDLTWGR